MLSQRHLWLVSGIMLIAGAVAAFYLLAVGASASPVERLADRFEGAISQLETVKGRLDIRSGGITLQQELWVRYPGFLRTETVSGPSAFSGTIVVLNDQEGWVFSSALNMATVVNRSDYSSDLAGDAGAGSMLERMPPFMIQSLRASYPTNVVGRERIAGRETSHLEIVIPHNNAVVPAGLLHIWIDEGFGYPLAWQDSSGREMRFSSVEFNQEIDAAVFTFVPPPSATVRRVPLDN